MDRKIHEAVLSLSSVYAKYFVEDFTNQVITNLGNQISLSQETKDSFIEQLGLENFDSVKFNAEDANPATKFIYECAQFAIEQEVKHADSREIYNEIKDLPSMYHEELNAHAFNSASLYTNTVDKTVLSVIGSDAKVAAGTIINGAKSRIENEETGGRVKFFNWGILSDGLWLNSALVKAYEKANIFRPGSEVKPYYTQEGFIFARNNVATPLQSDVKEAFSLLMSHADANITQVLEGSGDSRWDLQSLLFKTGTMTMAIDFWEKSVSRPNLMMESIEHLSQLAVVIPHLTQTAKKLAEENVLNEDIVQRLEGTDAAITLSLAAFEAARETIYNQSLVMYVDAHDSDPMVDVFVNQDTVNDYLNAGGEEADLVSFGTYLDPRKGMVTAKGGWPVEWAVKRRGDILTEVMMSENDRLSMKRTNDKNVIQGMVKSTLMDVSKSYAEAVNMDMVPNRIKNQIDDIARKVASPVAIESFSLEGEITNLLTNVVGDPFVSEVAARFINYATSENEVYQQNARDLTIVETAFKDAANIVFAN